MVIPNWPLWPYVTSFICWHLTSLLWCTKFMTQALFCVSSEYQYIPCVSTIVQKLSSCLYTQFPVSWNSSIYQNCSMSFVFPLNLWRKCHHCAVLHSPCISHSISHCSLKCWTVAMQACDLFASTITIKQYCPLCIHWHTMVTQQ